MLDINSIEKINKMESVVIQRIKNSNSETKRGLLEKLLLSAEKLTVITRECLSMCSERKAEDLIFIDAKNGEFNISIKSDKNDSFIITLPFLLPNRRTAATYFKHSLIESLRDSLKIFCKRNHVIPFQYASVTFITYYSPSSTRNSRHDNDNSEISIVLNALTGFLIPDDSSLCCDLHILSREAEEPYTKIIVSNREEK